MLGTNSMATGSRLLDQDGDWSRIIVPNANRPAKLEGPVWVPTDALVMLGSERYDLSSVGRVKMGLRLGLAGDVKLEARSQCQIGHIRPARRGAWPCSSGLAL